MIGTHSPKLRFPEFADDWKQKRLDDAVLSIDSGWSPQCGETPALISGWGVLKTTSVSWAGYDEQANKSLPDNLKPRPNIEVKPEDILVTRAGPSDRVGVVSHVRSTRDKLMLSDKIIRIKCKTTNDSQFIARCLGSRGAQSQLLGRKSGLAKSQTNISQKDLRSVTLNLPTTAEQQKIADFLTAVDTRIQQLSQKKTLLERWKKGLMQQLFSQTLRFKDDNGGDFPDWEEKRLGQIATFLKGKGISKAEIDENGPTPCVRYGELYTHYAELIDTVKSRTSTPRSELELSQQNDVIIPASGETHIDIATASCVTHRDIALGGDLNIIRSGENGVFLSYYLNNACKHAISGLAQGSSVIHLYAAQLKLLKISLPSKPEQTKIANSLTAIDRKIDTVSQQIQHSKTFKQGLLQQMFV